MSETVRPGEMCRAYALKCAGCGATLLLAWDARAAAERTARAAGWSRTVTGWRCACRLGVSPDQHELTLDTVPKTV